MLRWLPILLVLNSCSTQVTREEAVATAYRYTQVHWLPAEIHVRQGPDSQGIPVRTPDRSLDGRGGWWQPGVPARSLPYQWGGFDTPESFLEKIAAGNKAGDVATPEKRRLGDAGTSAESCGIDCSGFISRCWNLKRPYSTAELPGICEPLASWVDLRAGDILLNDKHVVLFVKWAITDRELAAYEAGPFPVWRVSACQLDAGKLRRQGYKPWRYREIVEAP